MTLNQFKLNLFIFKLLNSINHFKSTSNYEEYLILILLLYLKSLNLKLEIRT